MECHLLWLILKCTYSYGGLLHHLEFDLLLLRWLQRMWWTLWEEQVVFAKMFMLLTQKDPLIITTTIC